MAFFDDLLGKLNETVDVVSKKTGDVVEVQKLKAQIRSMEKEMDRSYIELGKRVFEKFQNGEALADEDKEICEDIAATAVLITEFENEINGTTKNAQKKCPCCGKILLDEALFCHNCGFELEPEEEKAEETAEEVPAAEAEEEAPEETVFEETLTEEEKALAAEEAEEEAGDIE